MISLDNEINTPILQQSAQPTTQIDEFLQRKNVQESSSQD